MGSLESKIDLVTLFILTCTAVIALCGFFSQKKISRAKNTIDFQNDFISSERIFNAFQESARIARSKISSEMRELALDISENESDLKAVRLTLNTLEGLANGVYSGVYEEDILFNSYAYFVTQTYLQYLPYIEEIRKRNPRYYHNFSKLAMNWKEKMSK